MTNDPSAAPTPDQPSGAPDPELDPGANTEMFAAFMEARDEPAAEQGANNRFRILTLGIGLLVLTVAVVLLLLD